jgi:cysteine-rich repeat protein
LCALLLSAAATPVSAAEPLLVMSIQSSGGTDVCNTDCVDCTPPSPECIFVDEEDLILCTPQSTGLPITSCHWSLFMQGDSANLQINTQLRATEVAKNGNITFVALTDTTVPGIGAVESDDVVVFTPDDLFKPFIGGGPYDDGALKLYLNGDLSQSNSNAKPWDALDILPDGTCENAIDATTADDHSCTILGSLSGGTPGGGLDGVNARDEDVLRCIPSDFAANGAVEDCDFGLFLYSSKLNGGGAAGLTSEIKALDFLSYNPSTISGEMVFRKGGGNPTGFPAHDPGKDLLLYTGTFGVGQCVPSGNNCVTVADCLMTDSSCNTGTCVIGGANCAHDDDCTGGGNTCANPRNAVGTVSKYFDGVAVGLSGSGQNIEGFTVLAETDGDDVPDGIDNCPNVANPPSVCSGPGPETCTTSGDCPMGETCVQADSDADSVGDACDQCNGRPDLGTCDACPGSPCPTGCGGSPSGDCSCGDGIADFPSEECDLAMQNGVVGSPCSATCQISGKCKINATTLGADCDDDDDCTMGQGCCGNADIEDNEVCDDGNTINNDVCTTVCEANPGGTPLLGCEDLSGPNIVPAAVKKTKFKDTADAPDIDRWKAKGEGIFATGLTIDPDTEDVKIIYNNTLSGSLFESTLSPGNCIPTPCFVQNPPTKLKWKFKDVEADVPGSPSWRKGKFTIKNNKVKFTLDGRKTSLFTQAEAGGMTPLMRQTIRVGDVCITAVISCLVKGGGATLLCTVVP